MIDLLSDTPALRLAWPPPSLACPNDTDQDGDCHLCASLPSGCFLTGLEAHQLGLPFSTLPMCQ